MTDTKTNNTHERQTRLIALRYATQRIAAARQLLAEAQEKLGKGHEVDASVLDGTLRHLRSANNQVATEFHRLENDA